MIGDEKILTVETFVPDWNQKSSTPLIPDETIANLQVWNVTVQASLLGRDTPQGRGVALPSNWALWHAYLSSVNGKRYTTAKTCQGHKYKCGYCRDEIKHHR